MQGHFSSSPDPIFEDVERLLPPVAHAFAYGSGVFHQPDLYQGTARPMIDYILAVDDCHAWHSEVGNIQRRMRIER